MKSIPSLAPFNEDSRGVATVVGFIFIFAILIILLSINQAQFVPQENREIEFQHFQDVRNDMVKVRSSIWGAGQANVSQFPTMTLGTEYPVRLFAVNPPSPSGTLETSKSYNIWINETGGSPEKISTRFLVYRNGYNEMDIGSIWYEHSVLYLDEGGSGGSVAIIEDQEIISGKNSARVTALQNDFRVTSTGEATLDLYPTENVSVKTEDMSGDVNLKIPTRLNETVYWDDSIGEISSNGDWEYHGTSSHPEKGIWWLNLTVKASSLKFNTVGIDSAPEDQGSGSGGVGPSGGTKKEPSTTRGLVYNDDAVAKDGDDNPSPDKTGGVEFSVQNQYENPVTVTSMTIDPDNPDIIELDDAVANDYISESRDPSPDEAEIRTENDSGDIEYSEWATLFGEEALAIDDAETISPGISGDETSGSQPRIKPGQRLDISMYEFYNRQGNGQGNGQGNIQNTDMSDEEVTITLTYEFDDGTVDSTTFQINPL